MNWYVEVLKKYAQFSGRARRMEFWMFTLINLLVIAALIALSTRLEVANILAVGYLIGIVIPCTALTVRRLHDTGRSGWWIFVGLVPLIGGIVVFIFEVLPGDIGNNAYGPDPKAA